MLSCMTLGTIVQRVFGHPAADMSDSNNHNNNNKNDNNINLSHDWRQEVLHVEEEDESPKEKNCSKEAKEKQEKEQREKEKREKEEGEERILLLLSFTHREGISPPYPCDHKLSWAEVQAIVRHKRFDLFGRLPGPLVVYLEFMSKVKQTYKTVGDYVLHSKFGYPCQPQRIIDDVVGGNSTTKLVALLPDTINNDIAIWDKNDFPYALEDEIQHHLIWSHTPPPEEVILKLIEKHLPGQEYCYFVNPPSLRSVANVYHVHILSRPHHHHP
jgi:hypothetical protein